MKYNTYIGKFVENAREYAFLITLGGLIVVFVGFILYEFSNLCYIKPGVLNKKSEGFEQCSLGAKILYYISRILWYSGWSVVAVMTLGFIINMLFLNKIDSYIYQKESQYTKKVDTGLRAIAKARGEDKWTDSSGLIWHTR